LTLARVFAAIHAIAQACGWRSLLEEMTQMPASATAMYLGARREQRVAFLPGYGIARAWSEMMDRPSYTR